MSPFAIRNYRFYWVARLAAMTAASAMMLIISWQVYNLARLTMSQAEAAVQIGLIGLIQFVPLFALTPVTGWVADRLDRRVIARLTLSLQLACAALLCWLTYAGTISLPALFAVAALLGVARAFAGPAFSALAPNLVPKELLPKAIALSTLAWQVGMIAGPGLAGFLYDWRPPAPYALSATLLAIAVIAMFLITPVERPQVDRSRHPIRQMIDGLAYVAPIASSRPRSRSICSPFSLPAQPLCCRSSRAIS
jgi:MFS family permease